MEDEGILKYDGTTVYDDFRDCCFHRGNTLQAPAMMIKILNAWYDKVKSLSEEQLKSIFPDDKHPSYNGVYFADWVVKYDKPTRFKPWPFMGIYMLTMETGGYARYTARARRRYTRDW